MTYFVCVKDFELVCYYVREKMSSEMEQVPSVQILALTGLFAIYFVLLPLRKVLIRIFFLLL